MVMFSFRSLTSLDLVVLAVLEQEVGRKLLFVAKKKSTKSVATNALLGPALTARKSHVLLSIKI